MGQRLERPEQRTCTSCSQAFVANWPQRLCYRCKRRRSSKSICEICGGRTNQTGYRRCGPCRYGPAPTTRAMTKDELAWLSGIIEGEGSFVANGRRFGAVRVVMTDKDVINRLAGVSGVGTVHAIKPRQAHHKQAWAWQVVRPPSIASLITAVAPFLLERRYCAASKVLALQDMAIPDRCALGVDEAWAWTAGLMEGGIFSAITQCASTTCGNNRLFHRSRRCYAAERNNCSRQYP